MKLKHLAIASATLFVAAAAHAQSSVTLYGLLDTSMLYTNNVARTSTSPAGSRWEMNSGSLSTSRWGLRGNEDLGGGLSAVFDLEEGFKANNGQMNNSNAGQVADIFGRQAWVGLNYNNVGQATMGRQYDFMVDYVAPMSVTGSGWGGNIGAHPYDNDNLDNDMRLNNSVKFSSASFNGLKVGAMYAFSGQAGGAGNNNAYSLGTSYAMGPLSLAAAYVQVNRSASLSDINTTGAVSTTDNDGISNGGKMQIWGAAAQYKLGNAAVGLVYSHSVTYNVTSLNYGFIGLTGSYVKFDNFEVNGRYFLRPDLSVGVAYTYTMGGYSSSSSGTLHPNFSTVVAQVDYALSRRVETYIMGQYQRVSGGGSVFTAQDYSYGAATGNQQFTVGAGMRFRF
jgi:predicted porin